MLCREGRSLDEHTFTSIDGRALGGMSRPGYWSEMSPRKITSELEESAEPVLGRPDDGVKRSISTLGCSIDWFRLSVGTLRWEDDLANKGAGTAEGDWIGKPTGGCTASAAARGDGGTGPYSMRGEAGILGMAFVGSRGEGALTGLSPGRGLIGSPGLSNGVDMLLR